MVNVSLNELDVGLLLMRPEGLKSAASSYKGSAGEWRSKCFFILGCLSLDLSGETFGKKCVFGRSDAVWSLASVTYHFDFLGYPEECLQRKIDRHVAHAHTVVGVVESAYRTVKWDTAARRNGY